MPRSTNLKRALLAGGVALSVMLAASAQARPVKHRIVKAAGPTPAELELKAQVDALKAEVQTLESRLDAQAQAQQQTQAQATQAQAQAQAAQTQVEAAQTQVAAAQTLAQAASKQAEAAQTEIKTLPNEVNTAAVKLKDMLPGSTTIGGRIFADVSGIQNFSNGIRQANSGAAYDLKRAYLIINHKFDNTFSANLTTDFTYDSTTKATQLFVKKAYLEAKLSKLFDISAGANDLPWIPFEEKLFPYRYVEKDILDRTNFGTTTDWGLHASGFVGDDPNDSANYPNPTSLAYQVSVFDGNGFKAPAIGTANRSDSVDVEARISATYNHVTAAIGGYEGKLGKDIVNPSPPFTPTSFHTAQRFDALLAYVNGPIRLGGEYFYAKDWNDVTQFNPLLTNTSQGFSGFGAYNFTPKIAIFGRYDYVQPFNRTTPNAKENYFNVGVSYKPIKALDFALVYKRDALGDVPLASTGILGVSSISSTDSGFNTGNGVIGGSVRGTYDEIGLFSQIDF